jgi:hypothetical protein
MARKSAALQYAPIVEFYPLYDYEENLSLFFDRKKTSDQKSVIKALTGKKGIYALYNSEAEVIYIGRTTERDLAVRIKESLSRVRTQYKRYYVEHGKFDGVQKKIQRKKLALWQVAEFFSAYVVQSKLIKPLESLLIRVMPNDLVNVRIEGNARPKTRSKSNK